MTWPSYRTAYENGRLAQRAEKAVGMLTCCSLCPRRCEVDRIAGETGFCRTGADAVVSAADAHFGEEVPISGTQGSGTIFFTHCNLLCTFCQNREISHGGRGGKLTVAQLAAMMGQLQAAGCHNINLVTPSHVVPQFLAALLIAARNGLEIPIVYNSSGYDTVETLRLLDGIVDIYMPDFKFWQPRIAREACQAADYPEMARRAMAEMHRQVGDLVTDDDGIARRGLLVRHLVLPGGMAGTEEVMGFIAERMGRETYVNIMDQYRPCGPAAGQHRWDRPVTGKEYEMALQAAAAAGIGRLDRRRPAFLLW